MVETHKRKRKNTVITKITFTIRNAEHIKQTLNTNTPYREPSDFYHIWSHRAVLLCLQFCKLLYPHKIPEAPGYAEEVSKQNPAKYCPCFFLSECQWWLV